MEYFKKLHRKLFYGTAADQDGAVHIGEFRKTLDLVSAAVGLNKLIVEYEKKKKITLKDILDFHAKFERLHPFEDGNGRVGRLVMIKECLRHGIDPFIIDDKHRGEYKRGIANWETDPAMLTSVAEHAQARLTNQKETLDLLDYCRPPVGRGAR